MNLIEKLLLVTCVFAITEYASSADQGVKFGEPCQTSKQCLYVTENSQCDSEKRRCLCSPGYGIETWNSTTCKKYPLHDVRHVKFSRILGLGCIAHMPNFTEMHWYRNGQKICSPVIRSHTITVSQGCVDDPEETDPEKNIFSSNLRQRVYSNDNYSCVAVTTDEKTTIVSTFQVITDPMIGEEQYKSYGSDGLIWCEHTKIADLHFSLVRDAEELPCILNTTWCSLDEERLENSASVFRILSLRANHTYTCEAYNKLNQKVATTEVYTIIVAENLKDPVVAEPVYTSYGSDRTIECKIINGSNMGFRLVRDGEEEDACPINTTWCSLEKEDKDIHAYVTTSSSIFKILDLNETHNYTCEVYDSRNEKITTTATHRIIVGAKPKILNFTLSPPDPDVPRLTKIVATARFKNNPPRERPVYRWRTTARSQEYPYNEVTVDVKDELVFIVSENEFESEVSIGPVEISFDLSLEVSNDYGKDEKITHVSVSAKYGEACNYNYMYNAKCLSNSICDSHGKCDCRYPKYWDESNCSERLKLGEPCETSAQCLLNDDNTQCDPEKKICLCTPGFGTDGPYYTWRTCRPYPFKEDQRVVFEKDLNLTCTVHMSNLLEIRWIRNDKETCRSSSPWCSQGKTEITNPERYIYESKVTLNYVLTDGTYTCEAITSDGRNFTVLKTDVKVDPIVKTTLYSYIGADETINCTGTAKTPNLDMRLLRDDNKACNLGATWCFHRKSMIENDGRTTSFFDILNLQANHTYTCDAYKDNSKLATVAVYYSQVGPKPKILKMTIDSNLYVEVDIQSNTSEDQLFRRWTRYDGLHMDVLQDRTFRYVEQPENQYQSRVVLSSNSLGRASIVRLEVSNRYGYDTKDIRVGVEFGEKCNSAEVCLNNNSECDRKTGLCVCRPGYVWDSSSTCIKSVTYLEKCDSTVVCVTKNTQCDGKAEQCLCRKGYNWDSPNNVCRKNGAMGMFAVKKEGIVMLALIILFTMFRSTSSTVC